MDVHLFIACTVASRLSLTVAIDIIFHSVAEPVRFVRFVLHCYFHVSTVLSSSYLHACEM